MILSIRMPGEAEYRRTKELIRLGCAYTDQVQATVIEEALAEYVKGRKNAKKTSTKKTRT